MPGASGMNGHHDNYRGPPPGHAYGGGAYRPDDPYNRGNIEPYYDRKEGPYDRRARDHVDRRLPNRDDPRSNGMAPHRDSPYEAESMRSDSSMGPSYELDHLATFTVSSKQGLLSPEDGIKKLRQMERTSGIWTMRVQLLLEAQDLVIIDRSTSEEIEKFSLSMVHEPTAVTNSDRGDVYNNIILFTVLEDRMRRTPREMHIFQCLYKAAQNVVDDIKAAKMGKFRSLPPSNNPQQASLPDREYTDHMNSVTRNYQPGPALGPTVRNSFNHDTESVLSERTDRDVQLLNHCFDDIERFVGRLQQAAEAFKELDRRRKGRDKKSKSRGHGEGMLTMRARPPPAKDFVDIFQKFKLAFILLAKLKPHIHDPNAPELVHFLFTPLSLVVEACKDPRNASSDFPSKVITPLLTPEAQDLLQNCLTSKEMDLWMSLGDSWTLNREQWRGYVPPYYPKFANGWQPPPGHFDEGLNTLPSPSQVQPEDSYSRSNYNEDRYMSSPRHETYDRRGPEYEAYKRDKERERERQQQREAELQRDIDRKKAQEQAAAKAAAAVAVARSNSAAASQASPSGGWRNSDEFMRDLNRKGAKACKVIHDRQGNNSKELTVRKGEVLELLDDSRNWWKLRNHEGQVGHVPFTIVSLVEH